MRKIRGNTVGTNMSPQEIESRIGCAGVATPEGGSVFNDIETNKATAKFATTFGSENTAAGECAIAGGKRIFKTGAEYVIADEFFHGEYGFTLIAYAADPNGEYAKNTISFEEAKDERYEAGSTHECWKDVSEWLAYLEKWGYPVPDMLMVSDGRFCLLEDLRYNEAYGTGAMAIGKGAVAFSRASKSFGYRTQTGYPPSAEHAKARPEAIVQTDENGNPVYPADNVGQGAFAIGADTAALANHTLAGGWGAIARNYNALAFGDHPEANGDHSVALNYKTKANAMGAIAAGSGTEVNGKYAFGVGLNGKVNGNYSIGGGMKCEVDGNFSITQGLENKARANCAAVFGAGLITPQQMVNGSNTGKGYALSLFGQYNAYANGELDNALLAVGYGTSDKNRKNAFVVNKDGSAKIAGKLSFGSIDAESRKVIITHKTSYNTPTINDKGDYVGQIWLVLSKEYDTTSEVHMYVGVSLGGYYWKKL